MTRLQSMAPAKVNLSLRVLGKRPDGYHEIASVVAFADAGDELSLEPADRLSLSVAGPFAAYAGPGESNLVLKAAHALGERIGGLRAGKFLLTKNLPAGAGLGGGSSDAGAALRLLAEANGLKPDDARLLDAARTVGADVPVCLVPKARLMHGIGETLSAPLELPPLPAVLVFPGKPLATAPVFAALKIDGLPRRSAPYQPADIPRSFGALIEFLKAEPNDLESTARALMPEIGLVSELLSRTKARLVRMSGSGSAVFGIYETPEQAKKAAGKIRAEKSDWWVEKVSLH